MSIAGMVVVGLLVGMVLGLFWCSRRGRGKPKGLVERLKSVVFFLSICLLILFGLAGCAMCLFGGRAGGSNPDEPAYRYHK